MTTMVNEIVQTSLRYHKSIYANNVCYQRDKNSTLSSCNVERSRKITQAVNLCLFRRNT